MKLNKKKVEITKGQKRYRLVKRIIFLIAFVGLTIYFYNVGVNMPAKKDFSFVFDSNYIGFFDGTWHSLEENEELKISKTNKFNKSFLSFESEYAVYDDTLRKNNIYGKLDDEESINSGKYIMDSSKDWGVFAINTPDKITIDIKNGEVVELQKKYIKDVLLNHGAKNTSVNIEKVIYADIDKDGNDEQFIIARNFKNEKGEIIDITPKDIKEKDFAIYEIITMLKKVENEYIAVPIYSKVLKEEALTSDKLEFSDDVYMNTDMYIYDLNTDGKCEVMLNTVKWDKKEIIVYEYNLYKFIPVIYNVLV